MTEKQQEAAEAYTAAVVRLSEARERERRAGVEEVNAANARREAANARREAEKAVKDAQETFLREFGIEKL